MDVQATDELAVEQVTHLCRHLPVARQVDDLLCPAAPRGVHAGGEKGDTFSFRPLRDLVAQPLQGVKRLVDVCADRRRRLEEALE